MSIQDMAGAQKCPHVQKKPFADNETAFLLSDPIWIRTKGLQIRNPYIVLGKNFHKLVIKGDIIFEENFEEAALVVFKSYDQANYF
jgi:hypothetical protein